MVAFSFKAESKPTTEGTHLCSFRRSCSPKLAEKLNCRLTELFGVFLCSSSNYLLFTSAALDRYDWNCQIMFVKNSVNVKCWHLHRVIILRSSWWTRRLVSYIWRCSGYNFDCIWRALSWRVSQRGESNIRFWKRHTVFLWTSLCGMYSSLFHSRTFFYFHVGLFKSRLVIGWITTLFSFLKK